MTSSLSENLIAALRDNGVKGLTIDTRHYLIEAAGPAKYSGPVDESELLTRITVNPTIFGGKPIVRGHRLAVEHVLGMLAAGDTAAKICQGYAWMEPEDVQACLVYARRVVGQERIEPLFVDAVA